MTVAVTPHLNFRGQAREALEFYRTVFGGHLAISTYSDVGVPADAPHAGDVVWGQVADDGGFRIMAYDVPSDRAWSAGDDPFFVSVRGTDADELSAQWARLADGATIRQPLEASSWAPLYGMLTDRFGVTWVLDIAVA